MSGFVMLGFVVVHLGGNLPAFAGSVTFNAYARSIRELGAPLVGENAVLAIARVVLAAALACHLLAHVSLMLQPSESPVTAGCGGLPPWFATLPVSVLQVSGAAIALFLVFHLLQLTLGSTHPAFVDGDPYHNTVIALGFWPVAMAYLVAAAAVGVHLLPGIWTGMASLGLINSGTQRLAATLAPTVALVVSLGLAAVPAAVLLGVLN
jgi:succinate dehydrogenase / fumarate reductase cytochrome b subunit